MAIINIQIFQKTYLMRINLISVLRMFTKHHLVQGSCPSGEDIRGWLQIVRGIEKAPEGMTMSEYAFRRSTTANPFPSQMGRVCPAPCQSGCNRNEVDDYVGINAVEQFIGDTAFKEGFKFDPCA